MLWGLAPMGPLVIISCIILLIGGGNIMDTILNFLSNTYVLLGLVVAAAGLIAVYFFALKKTD